jgi:hypothetical protein
VFGLIVARRARAVHTYRVRDSRRAGIACAGLALFAITSCSSSSSHTAPSPTTTATVHTTTPATVSTPTTRVLDAAAKVAGRADGSPPCAPLHVHKFGADTTHPDRSPLQAVAVFAHGVRWAVCGADSEFQGDFLNLRSADNGKTWRITDVGFSFVLRHAGDQFRIKLASPNVGHMRIISLVGQADDKCATIDGGHTWHCTMSEPIYPGETSISGP